VRVCSGVHEHDREGVARGIHCVSKGVELTLEKCRAVCVAVCVAVRVAVCVAVCGVLHVFQMVSS